MFIIHELGAQKVHKCEIVKICDVGVMNTAEINGSYWPETSGQDVPLMYSSTPENRVSLFSAGPRDSLGK